MPDRITVRAGQIWADNDKRSAGRHVRIVETSPMYAIVEPVAYNPGTRAAVDLPGRKTRIALRRFHPTSTGYRLVAGPLRDT